MCPVPQPPMDLLTRCLCAICGDTPDALRADPKDTDMTDPTAPSEPIVVNAKAGPDQWAAAIRQLLLVLAGIAGAFGYSHLAGEFSGPLVIAAPLGGLVVFVLGQIKTRQSALKLTVMAKALPDEVAKIKP